ncbi:hypothetical protein J6590_002927 [Homalodisca vitripennis]|nr:hypothetical protein J6590_002927 [Homalodisca vitripennis]
MDDLPYDLRSEKYQSEMSLPITACFVDKRITSNEIVPKFKLKSQGAVLYRTKPRGLSGRQQRIDNNVALRIGNGVKVAGTPAHAGYA